MRLGTGEEVSEAGSWEVSKADGRELGTKSGTASFQESAMRVEMVDMNTLQE